MRTVIFHAHIFKNAGTTLDWILNSGIVTSKTKIKAVSSHSMAMPILAIRDINVLPLLMLRHPVLRAKSVYVFERQQVANTPGAIKAKELNFNEYVEWRMRSDVGCTIRNYQLNFISKNFCAYKLDRQSMLDFAVEQFQMNETFGIVEMFDQSLALIARQISKYFPDFDTSYQKKNVLNFSELSDEKKIEQIQDELGSTYDIFLENNQDDIRFYEECKRIQEKRLV